MLGSLISGSLIPPFRLVNQSAILSLICPPINIPIKEPIMAEKKQSPVCQAWNPYAVAYAGATLDVTATRNPIVTDITRDPHSTGGSIINATGRTKRLISFSFLKVPEMILRFCRYARRFGTDGLLPDSAWSTVTLTFSCVGDISEPLTLVISRLKPVSGKVKKTSTRRPPIKAVAT